MNKKHRYKSKIIAVGITLALVLTLFPSMGFGVETPEPGTLEPPNISLSWVTASAASSPDFEFDDNGNRIAVELTPATNANTSVTMQFEFSLAPDQSAAPGEIQIRIPMQIFETRASTPSVPVYTGDRGIVDLMLDEQAGATGFYYTIDEANKEFVITNFAPFGSAQKLVCQIPYVFLPTNVPDKFEKQIKISATFSPAAEPPDEDPGDEEPGDEEPVVTPPKATVTATSNSISVKLNTSVRPSNSQGSLTKGIYDAFDSWQSTWGTDPDPQPDHCYVIWQITYRHTRNASTQLYSVVLTDELGNILEPGSKYDKDGKGKIIGIKTGITNFTAAGDAVTFTPSTFDTSTGAQDTVRYVLVRYSKTEMLSIEVDPLDPKDGSAFNSATATLWGYDNPNYSTWNTTGAGTPDWVFKATGKYIHSAAAFDYPDGGGEGWNTYAMTKNSSPPLVTDATYRYGATLGSLNMIDGGVPVNLWGGTSFPYTYAVHGYAQGFGYTFIKDDRNDPNNIENNAHKLNYTTELVDDMVFLKDQKLLPGDYSFVSCYLAYNEYIFTKQANGKYARTKVTDVGGGINEYGAVEVWYKSTEGPDEWVKDGKLEKNSNKTAAYGAANNTGRTYKYTKEGSGSPTAYYTLSAEAITPTTTASAGTQYLLTNVLPNSLGPSVPIMLPAGTYAVKFVHTGARYAVEMKAYISMTLNPTGNTRNALFGPETALQAPTLLNVSSMPIWTDYETENPKPRVSYGPGSITATTNAQKAITEHDKDEYGLTGGDLVRHGASNITLRGFTSGSSASKTAGAVTDNKADSIKTSVQTLTAFEFVRFSPGSVDLEELDSFFFDNKILNEQVEGTFYDLLPRGTTYSLKGFSVKTYTSTTNNISGLPCDYTIETVPNWQGSGRTMMIVDVKVTPDQFGRIRNFYTSYDSANMFYTFHSGFQLTYTLVNSYDNINDNTVKGATNNIAKNVMAYRAKDKIVEGVPQTVTLIGGTTAPTSLTHAASGSSQAHFFNLEGAGRTWTSPIPTNTATTSPLRDDTKRNTVYGTVDITYTKPASTAFGIMKKVKSESDVSFKNQTAVVPGGLYSYELRYTNGDEGKAQNLIFYDVLEFQGDWAGTFEHVDTSYAESRGIAPKVYYSTAPQASIKPFDPLDGTDEWNDNLLWNKDYTALNETGIWTDVCPADKSEVTAIAVDMSNSSKAGGGAFTIEGVTSIYCLVYMRAPVEPAEYVDDIIQKGLEARNRVSYTCDYFLTGDTEPSFTNKQSEEVAVKMRVVQAEIEKGSHPETSTDGTPTAVNPGDPIEYTVSVTNIEEFAIYDVVVVDNIPAGLIIGDVADIKYYPGTAIAGARPVGPVAPSLTPARVDLEKNLQKLTFTIKSIGAGEIINILIPVTVPIGAAYGVPYENQAAITEINGAEYEIKSEITHHIVYPSIVFEGVKNITNRPLPKDDFTFILWESNAAGDPIKVLYTAKNAASFEGAGNFEFHSVQYNDAVHGQKFYYLITEEIPAEEDMLYNVEYDTRAYFITVEIENVAGKITKNTTVELWTYTKEGEPGEEKLIKDDLIKEVGLDEIEFFNEFTPPEDEIVIFGRKAYAGADLGKGKFTFGLYDFNPPYDRLPNGTAETDAEGNFSFEPITYKKESFGAIPFHPVDGRTVEIKYIVSEDAGDDPWIVYASNSYEVTVTLRQMVDENHPIVATVTPNQLNTGEGLIFSNLYVPTGELELLATKKANALMTGMEFGFIVYEVEGEVERPVFRGSSESATGKESLITFLSNFKYTVDDVDKVFEYKIVEDEEGLEGTGWAAGDPITFYVKVTDENDAMLNEDKELKLSDDGKLTVKAYSDEDCLKEIMIVNLSGFLVFENTFKKTFAIEAEKAVAGTYAPEGIEFSFTLTELTDGDPANVKPDGIALEATCTDSGAIEFDSIELPPGTYWFKIVETDDREPGAGTDDGEYDWDYDIAVRVVKVVVSEDPDIDADIEFIEDDSHGGEVFTNTFVKAPVDIAVHKTVRGRGAPRVDFSFTLRQLDVDGMSGLPEGLAKNPTNEKSGGIVRTKIVHGSGDAEFVTLMLSAGEYWFKLGEIAGSSEDWEYDESVFLAKAVVTDADSEFTGVVTYYEWDEDANDGAGGWVEADLGEGEYVEFVNFFIPDIEPIIHVEVAKDTIKRTSAAFDGRASNVGVDGEPINNVGDVTEHYRYDIDFRSMANVQVDEFVVDDPLEAVRDGYIRVTEFWTPAVWGDIDGMMNVWYKSKSAPVGGSNPDLAKALTVTKIDEADRVFPTPLYNAGTAEGRNGWKLWRHIDQGGEGYSGIITSVKLGLPKDLAAGDYVTAIRLEYGEVAVGFTSKNYGDEIGKGPDVPSNTAKDGSDKKAPYRYTNGSEDYLGKKTGAGRIEPLANPITPLGIKSLDSALVRVLEEELDMPIPKKGATNDWTPVEGRVDYSEEALNATGLLPATYLVKAVKALDEADIVSSAAAKGAYDGKATGMYDQDQDAVLTRVISPIAVTADVPDVGRLVEVNSFLQKAGAAGLKLIDGIWYDDAGRRASMTGDAFVLNFWVILCIAALLCIALLLFTFLPNNGRRGRNKIGKADARKGGGQK